MKVPRFQIASIMVVVAIAALDFGVIRAMPVIRPPTSDDPQRLVSVSPTIATHIPIMAKKPPSDISIGKFDILATYTYARALLDGLDDDEAKQRGTVAAIMGARARLGIRKEHHEEFQAQKEAAEANLNSLVLR